MLNIYTIFSALIWCKYKFSVRCRWIHRRNRGCTPGNVLSNCCQCSIWIFFRKQSKLRGNRDGLSFLSDDVQMFIIKVLIDYIDIQRTFICLAILSGHCSTQSIILIMCKTNGVSSSHFFIRNGYIRIIWFKFWIHSPYSMVKFNICVRHNLIFMRTS